MMRQSKELGHRIASFRAGVSVLAVRLMLSAYYVHYFIFNVHTMVRLS